MMKLMTRLSWLPLVISLHGLAGCGGCSEPPKGRTYYERAIEPILKQSCEGRTSGCHRTANDDVYGIAAGNFDVSSFDNVQKRRDVLQPFGAYPYPLLLIKAVGPGQLTYSYNGKFRKIDVQHSGAPVIQLGSDAYFTLAEWLDNGATENGLRPASPPVTGSGDCSEEIPAGFDSTPFRTIPAFDMFRGQVQPIFKAKGCTAASCHGAPQADLYLTCGNDDEQIAFNMSRAWGMVSDTVDDSQLLRVPLGTAGGRRHSGGDQFTTADPDFATIRSWAQTVGRLGFGANDPLRQFFADNIQPIFVDRGCSFEACHSPQATNDFKLRQGFVGFYSTEALERNYSLVRNEFMALEFPDARRGRVVAKGLLDADPRLPTEVHGIIHRGGSVLETPNQIADRATCGAFDPMTSTPYCAIQEWLDRERASLVAANQLDALAANDNVKVVYVERTANNVTADRIDVDAIEGNAELKVIDVPINAAGALQPVAPGAATTISTACGLDGQDIRAPNVANDGNRVIFAGRQATSGTKLSLFVATLNPVTCTAFDTGRPAAAHDFDPVFSPDGAFIVFASTRGAPGQGVVPSRRRFLPQSDLWRIRINGTAPMGAPEQMTFLSNSELGPNFMREGRVTMTTEKVSQGFYQLSGRRINWDLTDYHPLLAQRKESRFVDPTMADLTTTHPSIGFASATDIKEGANGDFLLIVSDVDASGRNVSRGGGALAIFNRSVGPFEEGRTDTGYVPSVRLVGSANASGRAGAIAAYRRPMPLPDGRILASFAPNAGAGNWDIVMVNPRPGLDPGLVNESLFTAGNQVRTDAVLAIKRPAGELYFNRRQLVFGGGPLLGPSNAEVHMPDAPMVFTLLVANLRRGRPIDDFDRATTIAVYREGTCAASCSANSNGIFENRTLLGTAPLAEDGSVKLALPAMTGVVFELRAGDQVVATMGEEHQLGPGERISMGISRTLHNAVCGGCHGSISGRELDVAVTPDALTGASASVSLTQAPITPK